MISSVFFPVHRVANRDIGEGTVESILPPPLPPVLSFYPLFWVRLKTSSSSIFSVQVHKEGRVGLRGVFRESFSAFSTVPEFYHDQDRVGLDKGGMDWVAP